MTGDRLRPSLFERLPAEARDNLPLLMDFFYGEVMSKISILDTQFKGRMSNHETEIKRAHARLAPLENCPCAVHRDPAHSCVILDLRDELAGIRTDSVAHLAEMRKENSAQLASINNRLARWGGGLAVVVLLLELLARLLPVLWR